MSDDANLFVFYRTDDLEAAKNAAFLVEGGKPVELQQGWSYRADPAHTTGMQNHVHVMLRKDDVSIINRDGTQSHGTTRDKVPNWVIDKIKANGLIESTYFVEASTTSSILVPAFTIGTAEARYYLALTARR